MTEQIRKPQPPPAFEYELFEGDPDHLRTVVATPSQPPPWIDPAQLKLKHRIGHGTFGDVWLATHHQSARDFEEYHEVAVKMLHPLKEDSTQEFVHKFEELFLKFREIQGLCWLYGITIINGKICIVMKIYEGSVADRMARLKGGKLQLSDVLRYGINLAKGIIELHSLGLLTLNLKPSNLLLNERDQMVLGDFGIPYLLLGIPLLHSDMVFRLGTPNYMAPEQWEPEVRGPISFETDSWGFGCSIVEMLTGILPWFGKSIEEIYHCVVINKEKPEISSGLPPAVENVLNGCFEYDFRNRPLMADILSALESSQNAVHSDGGWIGQESRASLEKSSCKSGYTAWYLLKDHLQVGDTVRSRKPMNASKPQIMDVPNGTVVNLETDTDKNGFVLVKVTGVRNLLKVHKSTLERVTSGFAVGDWVSLKEKNKEHSPVGIVHSVQHDGSISIGFIGLPNLWKGNISELQRAEAYYTGQFVRLKANIASPRFEWPQKRGGWATGRISQVFPNGCLEVGFPGRLVFGDEPNSFLADPAEVELVSFDTCPGVVEKYKHVEDFHWAIRPLAVALTLFSTVKIGMSIGRKVNSKLKTNRKGDQDGQRVGNAVWLPPPVANILFKEGASTATVR